MAILSRVFSEKALLMQSSGDSLVRQLPCHVPIPPNLVT